MAETKAILSSDKSAAPAAALSLLCALIAVQLFIAVCGLWKNHGKDAGAAAPAAAIVAAPSSPFGPLVIPPVPVFTNPMPSATTAPPPLTFANPLPPPIRGQAARPMTEAMPAASSPPQNPPAKAPRTGNPEADELLDVAAQSLDLGDENGAMEALNRADLLLPNNPVIMREKSLALHRQGVQALQDQAKEVPAPAGRPALPPPSSPLPGQGLSRPPPPGEMLNHSFGKPAVPPPSATAPSFVQPGGALSLGPCHIVRDSSVVRGERFALKVPLIAAPGEVIDPAQMTIDVMFYDKVNDERIELTMADKPKATYDTPGDFKNRREEVISVPYNLPEFTPAQISELGRHVFYGYVVKLYYKSRLTGATAYPPDLNTMGDSGTSPRGAANPAALGRN